MSHYLNRSVWLLALASAALPAAFVSAQPPQPAIGGAQSSSPRQPGGANQALGPTAAPSSGRFQPAAFYAPWQSVGTSSANRLTASPDGIAAARRAGLIVSNPEPERPWLFDAATAPEGTTVGAVFDLYVSTETGPMNLLDADAPGWRNLRVRPFSLKGVYLEQIYQLAVREATAQVQASRQGNFFSITPALSIADRDQEAIERRGVVYEVLYRVPGFGQQLADGALPHGSVTEFFPVEALVQAMAGKENVEKSQRALLSALEAGLADLPGEKRIRFHDETSLLIVSGTSAQVEAARSLIRAMVDQIQVRRFNERISPEREAILEMQLRQLLRDLEMLQNEWAAESSEPRADEQSADKAAARAARRNSHNRRSTELGQAMNDIKEELARLRSLRDSTMQQFPSLGDPPARTKPPTPAPASPAPAGTP